jgi:mRNA interferase RelE/StbE
MFNIEFSPMAAREFKKLPINIKKEISNLIDNELVKNPFMDGYKKLSGISHKIKTKLGSNDLYRVRINDYRVLYSVDNGTVTILVFKIGHRREVYQFLKSGL